MIDSLRNIFHATKKVFSIPKDIEWLKQKEWNDYKSEKVISGQILSNLNAQKKQITDFNEVEFRVFSQFGDDGIIQWLISNLPFQNKTFIEFGVEDFRESNTRFLLINNYWSGFVMDGSPQHMKSLQNEIIYIFHDIIGHPSFITAENINDLLKLSGFGRPIDILSIDIDGNDYWVWKAINSIDPVLIICE